MDPDLLKKLSWRQPKIVKELFDIADRYASQEEAMAAENDDRPRQNLKKDSAKSSKPKDRKRKGDDLVAAAERGRPPRAPRTEDFKKVMEATCPFHPKGKHAAKDCYSLKDYIREHTKDPAQGARSEPRPTARQPCVPRSKVLGQHDIRRVGSIRVQAEAEANRSRDQCSYAGRTKISQVVGTTDHFRPLEPSGERSSPGPISPGAGPHHPDGQAE